MDGETEAPRSGEKTHLRSLNQVIRTQGSQAQNTRNTAAKRGLDILFLAATRLEISLGVPDFS